MWMRMIVLCLSILVSSQAFAQKKGNITLLIHPHSSYKVSQAISDVVKIPEAANKYNIYFYTTEDLKNGKVEREIVAQSKFIIVDDMGRELRDYALKNVDFKKIKLYGLCSVPKEPEKIISDLKVKQYWSSPTRGNIKNLLLFLLNRDCGLDVNYAEPQTIPEMGIFHPQSSKIFTSFEDYLSWYKEKGLYREDGFWVGIPDHGTYAFPGEVGEIVSSLIHNLEKNNINVLPVYSYPSWLAPKKFFFNERGKALIDIIAAFTFKFSTDERAKNNLMKLGVPVLSAIRMYYPTISEWRESPQGLSPMLISYAICMPEINGLIEPSVLGGSAVMKDERTGKDIYVYKPIAENIEFLVRRIKAWRNIQVKANKDKKIAIMYWNHGGGKHNVGAAYLNVFRSLEEILKRMREEGYTIEGELPSEEEIKEFVLKSGRNIGSWAPGELDTLINSKKVLRLPISKYQEWYKDIDESYKERLEAEWGKIEDSNIMIKDKEIIIPYVNLGNVILVPQPSRAFGADAMKMYHSTQLWTHHQYTAFYLWLKHEFNVDAIVSLGTHGTHEWLPGKQAGLSQSCPPEVLIQDIPNIYPYIVDDIGEGIQAKRRGRGVIVDHNIPPLMKAGIYEEYRELTNLIDEYNKALPRSEELAKQKFKRIKAMVKELTLDKDLLLEEVTEESMEEIEHYLMDLQEANVPYGMHTFGVSPKGDALKEFCQIIKERHEDIDLNEIKKKLGMCYLEIDHLIDGLDGKYILPGEGNDPLRNPEAIPTGNNFYGFDPAKVPSKDAFAIGKQQAEEMVEKYLKEKGEYPDKIALILFSIEVHRNEGTQIGTALYLMGMKPVWDKNNKVIGVEPIPGKILGRPRIDVHLRSSGLFRDCFPNVILLLDDAVRQASQLKDVENFIAKHSKKIKTYLLKKGYSEEEAENLCKIRVFAAKPGSYGAKIGDLTLSSGLWESDEEIADVFINYGSFGYGKGVWGKPLKSVYKKSLEDVKIVMHTKSSNVIGSFVDPDGQFDYLGGLALAVKRVSGEYPDVVISNQKDPENAHIEDIERFLAEELRTRYLNPKWIEGMKKDGYAGARLMSIYAENIFGYQVTMPFSIDQSMWNQVYQVYVEDKYDLDMKEFFDKNNPWAIQSIDARMLEAIRKDYWDASDEIKKRLAVEYTMNVIEKGMACCHHTCNNPALNQMVVNIISLPGMLSPELVNQFKAIVSKAMGMDLDKAVAVRIELLEKLDRSTKKLQKEEKVVKETKNLTQTTKEIKQEKAPEDKKSEKKEKAVEGKKPDKKKIEGYEMVEEKPEDTKITVSGSEWMVMVIVIGLLSLLVIGWRRKI
jgi:cobaltochelatase CobN